MQEIVVEYNDTVIYPDKIRLNCHYHRHYSFVKDIQMIFCTVLGRKMRYGGRRYRVEGLYGMIGRCGQRATGIMI